MDFRAAKVPCCEWMDDMLPLCYTHSNIFFFVFNRKVLSFTEYCLILCTYFYEIRWPPMDAVLLGTTFSLWSS